MKFVGEIKLIPDFNFLKNKPILEDARFYITIGSEIINENANQTYTLKKGKFINSEWIF